MNNHGTLEEKSTDEPLPTSGIDDADRREGDSGAPGRTRTGRSFRGELRVDGERPFLAGPPGQILPRLSRREERRLAKLGQDGDRDAEQRLITANLPLVFRVVRDFAKCGVPLDDLIQEGNLGLIRAARQFVPSNRTFRFGTYASYWIRRYIVRALARNASLIQGPARAHLFHLQYREAVDKLRAQETDPAHELGSSSARIEEVDQPSGSPPREPDELPPSPDRPTICQTLAETTVSNCPAPEEQLTTNEDRAMVCAALRRLSPFEAWVICERFGLDEPTGSVIARLLSIGNPRERATANSAVRTASAGCDTPGTRPSEAYFQRTYADMGRSCGLSVFRLRQVEKTAIDKLRAFLNTTTGFAGQS